MILKYKNYTIREIEYRDNKQVENVIRTCLIEFGGNHEGTAWMDPDLGRFSEIYVGEGHKYWVAEDETGKIAGGVGIGSFDDENGICELQKMYCLQEARGTGIAHRLLELSLVYAAKYYKQCYLETLDTMIGAQKFYAKYGFYRLDEALGATGHYACEVCLIKDLSYVTLKVNNREYQIHKLLGKGKGGYSYLASRDGQKYVLKQIHHEPCDHYQFGNKIQAELHDYKRLKNIGIAIPEMKAADIECERILKEYVDGDTVQELVQRKALPDICLQQVQEMCRKLYPANTNIDYYPTNFVLQGDVLYYIDYECNDYMDQWNFENWGIQYWTY